MTSHSLLIYFLVKSQLYLRPWYYVTSFCLFLLSYSASLVIRHFLCIFQVKIWISIDICSGIFTCYVQWVEVRGDCSFCWYWWDYWPSQFKLSLFCWYWWNYWPSLFKLSLFCWYWWNYWPSLFKLSLCCWYWWNYWPSLFKLSFFCWYWWNYWPSLVKLSLFCWYWWNYWPSLFKLSLVLLILVELLTITV